MLSRRYQDDGVALLSLDDGQRAARDSVQKKVRDGLYRTETPVCAICTGADFTRLAGKDRYGLSYNVVICESCGLVQTNPRMDQQAYDAFYDDEYRPLYVGRSVDLQRFFDAEVVKGRRIARDYEQIAGTIGPDVFVVDVGCGAGGVLLPFRQAGCVTLGCDLGTEYLDYGRDVHGLDLVQGTLGDLDLPRQPDLIIYSHVLEHILEPRDELGLVRAKLSAKGILYIEVPGIRSIRGMYRADFLRYLQNAHTYHFTLATISRLVAASDFEILRGDESIRLWARPGRDPGRDRRKFGNDRDATVTFLKRTERLRPFFRFHPHVISSVLRTSLLEVLDRLGLRDKLRSLRRG